MYSTVLLFRVAFVGVVCLGRGVCMSCDVCVCEIHKKGGAYKCIILFIVIVITANLIEKS